jgi:hypothetical protein
MTTIVIWLIYPWIFPTGVLIGSLIFIREKYKVIQQIREEKEFAKDYEKCLRESRRFKIVDKESYKSELLSKFSEFKVK